MMLQEQPHLLRVRKRLVSVQLGDGGEDLLFKRDTLGQGSRVAVAAPGRLHISHGPRAIWKAVDLCVTNNVTKVATESAADLETEPH
jgi:hypothetical protein